ncbi:hypothetical protein SRB5_46470 [Streptomyces sp. RB5]|uniref:Translation initiation factor 2 n=1 Tax=Streptomyces smaragdinus TaxID=2585196 RepID=A0A7K0CLX2_9ACTN|nr:translation initiation factor 2 [Streptomyces smaragdinus]MQY14480.1 hypothetical protein [Streptomyces smaragdinus]
MLLAARSAVALHRLLDAVLVFAGDERVTRLFTLVPGSDFGVDALAAVERIGGRTVPWSEALRGSYDLVLSASPKGDVRLIRGTHVLLPHGAGYSKSLPGEGSDSASGLDPVFLRRTDLALHAVAHPDQAARLVAWDDAAPAKVVGDPTLERLLASRPLRDRYRAALGTGSRTLVVLASTWGPESLLHRHPGLAQELAARLPYDAYQLALVLHPNEHSRLGSYELAQRLAPACDAGLIIADPYEEWASLLIAADALITDHGSAALYYTAAADRPAVGVHEDDGAELIPDSPMHTLLRGIPRLRDAGALIHALRAWRPGPGAQAARQAFDRQGQALDLLRSELYALLGLTPPPTPARPRPLPAPRPAVRTPAAFDVDTDVTAADEIRVTRRPAGLGPPGDHLAAEYDAASEPYIRSAGLLYRRPLPQAPWAADAWIRHALDAYPGCRTAAAILPDGLTLLGTRDRPALHAVRAHPRNEAGRIIHPDPAAVASAVHTGRQPSHLRCRIGDRTYDVTVRPATPTESATPF